jgi:hypothetical protein
MLLSIVIVLVLSLGLFAGAQGGGGAVGTALGQVGKPYAFGTDGPNAFSCTGLVRFALRSIGIMDAPWDHHAYLSTYPTVASPQPGDVVVYPDGAAMYIGNDQVVMANHADGAVGTYPMGAIGTPIGFARPGGVPTGGVPTGDGTGDKTPVGDAAPAGDPAPVDFEEPIEEQALAPVPTEQPVPIEEQALAPVPIEEQALAPAPIEEQAPALAPIEEQAPAPVPTEQPVPM